MTMNNYTRKCIPFSALVRESATGGNGCCARCTNSGRKDCAFCHLTNARKNAIIIFYAKHRAWRWITRGSALKRENQRQAAGLSDSSNANERGIEKFGSAPSIRGGEGNKPHALCHPRYLGSTSSFTSRVGITGFVSAYYLLRRVTCVFNDGFEGVFLPRSVSIL